VIYRALVYLHFTKASRTLAGLISVHSLLCSCLLFDCPKLGFPVDWKYSSTTFLSIVQSSSHSSSSALLLSDECSRIPRCTFSRGLESVIRRALNATGPATATVDTMLHMQLALCKNGAHAQYPFDNPVRWLQQPRRGNPMASESCSLHGPADGALDLT